MVPAVTLDSIVVVTPTDLAGIFNWYFDTAIPGAGRLGRYRMLVFSNGGRPHVYRQYSSAPSWGIPYIRGRQPAALLWTNRFFFINKLYLRNFIVGKNNFLIFFKKFKFLIIFIYFDSKRLPTPAQYICNFHAVALFRAAVRRAARYLLGVVLSS